MITVQIVDRSQNISKSLSVAPSTTGFDLQSLVATTLTVPPSTSVILMHHGAKLADKATLQTTGVASGDEIQVMYRVGGKTVNVMMPNGAMQKVSVDEEETVNSLIVKQGFTVGRLANASLSFNADVLDGAVLIKSLRLTDGDVLRLTTEVQGG